MDLNTVIEQLLLPFPMKMHGFSSFKLLQGDEDLIIVHDALDYGDCHLSLAIPKYGIFENVNSLNELAKMPQWTPERPLRVATGFTYLGPRFMKENGLNYVTFSVADGALEAAPAMGIADAIVDLVSSATTLKENNLKEIEGGVILESQKVIDPVKRCA
ncbi:ATP phosphoribosyltransferase 2, chloroplastic [Castilleja foliolosa]|uniref:ATP phosphoribosyltransferase n=1 Tax=Castilleja foliolosa TaxID=1961234 RepID=A0ABD3EA99_9LAMI